MKNFRALLAVLPMAIVIASCTLKGEAPKEKTSDVIPVKVMPVNAQSQNNSVQASGQFTTDDEVMLSFKIQGVIDRIFVKEGDAVHKGQLLATLNLTEISAQVQQAQLGYEKASRDYQRVVNLHNDSVATLEQLQNAKTALDIASQQLRAASFNKSYSEIHAEKDGFVLKKLANEGQVISSGTPVFQTNGAQSGNWLLRVGLSDKEWAAVRVNDPATITLASNSGEFEGKVFRRSEGADAASGSFTVDIKFTGNKPAAIAAGMFGKAVIQTSDVSENNTAQTWLIPYDALLDGDGSTGFVFVTNDDKTVHKQKVTIAGMEKNNVIISDGLQSAHSVIVSGSAYLNDNSQIRIVSQP